ncbi:ABC transporter ATP-binding protein [Bradyrhizobium iriomotense]|uniref:ABC transporter ATP-binding protein n=1 Tax=Bradyrhizobium iriomotense TaxID=441950 RepID=UPI001B8A7612|nr:ABC transporter ATP-binding protein [Bradyrhizobium iriomotense]MBR0781263.1 ABC transporter ATP-binding protein [Bradyrhizobium iriomotense]
MSSRTVKQRVGPGIYLLRFKTQYELTSTFLRVQEHYESPEFHGRVFSLEQYMDWYAEQNGNFTYYQDWSGFNVPSTAFAPFYSGAFDPLSRKEKRLLGMLARLRGRFYVIGIYQGGGSTLRHELAHALFFTDADYRKQVREAMRSYDTRALGRQIAKAGYAQHVIEDETQAYLIAPSGKLGAASKALLPLRRKLRALFREHATKLSVPAS